MDRSQIGGGGQGGETPTETEVDAAPTDLPDEPPTSMTGPEDAAVPIDTKLSVDSNSHTDAMDALDSRDIPDVLVSGDTNVPEPPKSKIIYLTGMPKKANFGGVAGADSQCNLTPPVPGKYKALISDGSTRTVGLNWALAPNSKYVRADGITVIGTTNANATFTFPLAASIGTQALSFWTGLNADWSTSEDNCSGWSATSGFAASAGLADATDKQAIMGVVENCASLAGAFFACVEQ